MKTRVGIYAHYNGASYTVAGYVVTKDPSTVDFIVSRLLEAGNIEEDKIRVIYTGDNEFCILVQSQSYSICYSSIIDKYAKYFSESDEELEDGER